MIHARPDYNRIQDPAGKIGGDEPVFLIRAKDVSAPASLRFWAEENHRNGGDKALSDLAESHATRMEEWQRVNGSKPADLAAAPQTEATQDGAKAHVLSIEEGWARVGLYDDSLHVGDHLFTRNHQPVDLGQFRDFAGAIHDWLDDGWSAASRTQVRAWHARLLALIDRQPGDDVNQETVERVEELVGMGTSAWDTVDPIELIKAVQAALRGGQPS